MQLRWLVPLVLVAGCSGGPEGPPDANPFCLEANEHSDLEWIQENVFTPSCSRFTACHQGRANDAAHLSLEEGKTIDETVNVESELFPEFDIIVPGDPENSYLMIILGHFPGPIKEDTGTMPYNSPLLCEEMRNAVQRWIENGATDGTSPDAGVDAMP
jgi:hypothetical protein